jgi:hypothetical protein
MRRRTRVAIAAAIVVALAGLPAAAARATSTSGCAPPDHPTPSCTGVPAGTAFSRTLDGDYTASTDGEVIDSWHITGDLIIDAADVVIRNSQVDGTVDNEVAAGSSFRIADSTVGTTTCATGGWPSINGHDFTATRVRLQGHQDGVDMVGDNVTVADSYLQPCYLPPEVVGSDGYHSDGVQDQCATACANLTLTHNTVDARAFYNGEPTGNSALNLGSEADGFNLRNVTLQDDMFLGGAYTTSLWWDAGASWTVTGNVWVAGTWTYGPISAQDTCAHQVWSGNAIVTVDSDYRVTATVSGTGCID